MKLHSLKLWAIAFISPFLGYSQSIDSLGTNRLSEVIVESKPHDYDISEYEVSTLEPVSISRYNPNSLVTSINEIPGVYIQSGALNTNRITIRGVGSRTQYGSSKVRTYLNQIPLTNGSGETSINMLDPESIASLHIVKGPKSAEYGSSLGGTMLITTAPRTNDWLQVDQKLTLGSYDLVKNRTAVNLNTEEVSLSLAYDHLSTDGFRENNNYSRNGLQLFSEITISEKDQLSILLNQINFNAQIPSSINQTDFINNPKKAAFTWKSAKGFEDNELTLTGISYAHQFNYNQKITGSIFYNYLDHYEPRPFNILSENTHGYGGRLVYDQYFQSGKIKWTLGGEIYRENYDWKTLENLYEDNNGNGSLEGDLLSNNEELRNRYSAFTTYTHQLTDKLEFDAGLNLTYVRYNYRETFNDQIELESNYKPVLAPSATLAYRPTSQTRLFANVSRGFNYPGLETTLNPDGNLNTDLRPENGWNYEFGLQKTHSDLSYGVNLYHMTITDLIVTKRLTEDQFIGINAGKTYHRGVEGQLVYDRTVNNFKIRAYTYPTLNFHEFKDFVDDDQDFSGNPLTGVPDFKISTGLDFTYSSLFLKLNHLHVSSMPMNDANTLQSDSYNLLSLVTGAQFNLWKNLEVEATFGIGNVLDEKYASSILINAVGFGGNEPRYFYPGMPRNYFGSVGVKYSLEK
ncbi:TonB-dependent receptor family protein [Fulvivirga aurantia]|uniref:TonB-dependent receptor family protein n=1 Tax=Fulvivirga aurantia TaxID=2529383 RepID=UPI00162A2B97|nr:TonB-dependent receptor [Fulvivirga aurantia]